MDSHNEHHYIPKFMLSGWQSGSDNKLSQMRWVRGRITEKRYKAKSVACERHLYSMQKFSAKPNQEIEPKFMTKHIDDPAAVVHRAMRANGFSDLSQDHRRTWTQFLVSLLFRGPGAINYVREKAIDAIRSQFPNGIDNPDELPDSSKELLDLYLRRDPSLLDFGTYKVPELIQTSSYNKPIFEAKWIYRKIVSTKENLLIGDRPVTLFGAETNLDLVYLPIAPDVAFFASRSEKMSRWINTMSDLNLVRKMNRGMVEQASVYVWGSNFEHQRLLELRLQQTPAGLGLGIGPRPPL